MLSDFINYLKCRSYNNKLILLLIFTVVSLLFLTYFAINKQDSVLGPDPSRIIGLILVDLVVVLILGFLIAKKFFQHNFYKDSDQKSSKLQNKIIIAFSLVAAIPTIIVSFFSAYFFNFGIQSWFDKKLLTVLEQSVIIGESYITEHTIQLKETALSVADDLSEIYYDLVHDPVLFNKTLNGEAELRSLDEAIVFQKSTSVILAQTPLSFALAFTIIPIHLFEKADRGERVEIKSDPTKIKILIKLREYNDAYLLVSRLIDSKVVDHIDKTNGAAAKYYNLKNQISSMQIKFAIIFILVALVLLLAAISWGAIFASQMVSPIRRLVRATEEVKDGDLTVQLSEENLSRDEIKILTTAFNRMIKQLNRQQKDLAIAQRALAWSDVARRVAHEINNPLTPIRLSAELLLRKFLNNVEDQAAFEKYINIIIRHTDDITKIVSEFVSFARLPLPIFNRIELVQLIKDMIDSRKMINDKITYEFFSNETEIDLVGDVDQINQVLINLIKNAEEHYDSSKLDYKIYVQLHHNSEFVTFKIEDNGPGFSHDILSKATEAYVTNRSKGTGLGLAIVAKIIQDHCGTIRVYNKSEGGAVVEIIFEVKELNAKLK